MVLIWSRIVPALFALLKTVMERLAVGFPQTLPVPAVTSSHHDPFGLAEITPEAF